MDGVAGANSHTSGSPAPTTLPWFAEDLSPEDLALVRSTQASSSSSSATPSSSSTWVAGGVASTEAEQRRKKQIILGGHWDENDSSSSSASKREPGTYLAIDCEMVGVGPKGSESVLARVSIVNWHGHTLLDRFVRPMEKVTDYRTWVSGIRAKDLKGAPTLKEVQAEVAALIKGRVLVGHAIQNDLKALLLSHPRPLVRDTATFKPLRDLAKTKHPGLRKLALLVLGIEIQKAGEEHSSVEDARTTMAIFRTQKDAWERSLKDRSGGKAAAAAAGGGAKVGAGQPADSAVSKGAAAEGEKVEARMRKGAAAGAGSATGAGGRSGSKAGSSTTKGAAAPNGVAMRKPAKRQETTPGWWKQDAA